MERIETCCYGLRFYRRTEHVSFYTSSFDLDNDVAVYGSTRYAFSNQLSLSYHNNLVRPLRRRRMLH